MEPMVVLVNQRLESSLALVSYSSDARILGGQDDGVETDNSSVTVINCLIHDNDGHGIDVTNSSTVTVWNSTIAHNGVDGVATSSGSTTVQNSIWPTTQTMDSTSMAAR